MTVNCFIRIERPAIVRKNQQLLRTCVHMSLLLTTQCPEMVGNSACTLFLIILPASSLEKKKQAYMHKDEFCVFIVLEESKNCDR